MHGVNISTFNSAFVRALRVRYVMKCDHSRPAEMASVGNQNCGHGLGHSRIVLCLRS